MPSSSGFGALQNAFERALDAAASITATISGNVGVLDTGDTRVDPNVVPNQPTGATGQDTVATPGTAVNLNGGTGLAIPDNVAISLEGIVANSGDHVYVGYTSSVGSSSGRRLADGQEFHTYVDDVTDVWIDADTAGDGVSWAVETE